MSHFYSGVYNYKVFENADIQTMVLLCANDSTSDSYTFDLRKFTKPGATLSDLIALLNKISTPKVSYLLPKIDRRFHQGKLLVFSDTNVENVLEKLLERKNFIIDGNTEVAQGIVAPQDFVNQRSKEILDDEVIRVVPK